MSAGLFRRCLCVLMFAAHAITATAGDKSLIVTQVGGSVLSDQRRLGLLDRLQSRADIELDAGASIVLFHVGRGQQFTLTGPARFRIGGPGVERLAGTGSIRIDNSDPALVRVLQRGDQVIAGAIVRATAALAVVERVAPSQPVFRWRARPHRGQWTFRLSDESGNLLFQTTSVQPGLVLPDTVRLAPGCRYLRELQWKEQNGAIRTETLSVEALTAAEDAELTALLPPPSAATETRVLYALYLNAMGIHSLASQIAPELSYL